MAMQNLLALGIVDTRNCINKVSYARVISAVYPGEIRGTVIVHLFLHPCIKSRALLPTGRFLQS